MFVNGSTAIVFLRPCPLWLDTARSGGGTDGGI
jgi:hypothetical protein